MLRSRLQVKNGIKEHIAVLAQELYEQIELPRDGVMVDTTVGHGGHSFLFASELGAEGVLIGFDVDEKSIQSAKARLKDAACKVILIRENFSQIAGLVRQHGIEKVDFILADLGLCSAQIMDEEIGLSFQKEMPLDMRIDKRLTTTAADIVNRTDEKTLSDIIYNFGEERASRRIARYIVEQRAKKPLTSTIELAAIICRALRRPSAKRKSRLHPATRTFQALRIVVNDELENLKRLLRSVPLLLKQNGYAAVISYHSLEDRLVKLDFRKNAEAGVYKVITKKPIRPARGEISENPRARSAKLRIAERVNRE